MRKLWKRSYRSMSVLVAIRIEYRENIPIVRLRHISDTRVIAEDQFVQDVGDNSGWYPFSGVYSAFDKYTRISFLIGNLYASDTPAFVATSTGYWFHYLRILRYEGI